MACVGIHRGEQEPHREKRQPVHRDEHPLIVPVAEGLRDELRREREEGHDEEEEEVDAQQHRIGPHEAVGYRAVPSHAAPIVMKLIV